MQDEKQIVIKNKEDLKTTVSPETKKIASEAMMLMQNKNPQEIENFEKKYNVKFNLIQDSNNQDAIKFSISKTVSSAGLEQNDSSKLDSYNQVDKNYNYREIPCNNNLFFIYYFAQTYLPVEKDYNLIKAFILKWLKENKVKIVPRKGIFNKNDATIYFYDNILMQDELEKELYEYIKRISKNNVLETGEFAKWFKKNYFAYKIFLDKLKLKIKIKIDINITAEDNLNMQVTNSESLQDNKQILSDKYYEYINQINGFTNFIRNFTTFDQKKLEELNLWGDYLIVAELLGLADVVSSQLNSFFPNFNLNNKKYNKIKITLPNNYEKQNLEEKLRDVSTPKFDD